MRTLHLGKLFLNFSVSFGDMSSNSQTEVWMCSSHGLPHLQTSEASRIPPRFAMTALLLDRAAQALLPIIMSRG